MTTSTRMSEENRLGFLLGERSVDTVVNDSPVDCQSRGVTEPQRDAVSNADCGVYKNLPNLHKMSKTAEL